MLRTASLLRAVRITVVVTVVALILGLAAVSAIQGPGAAGTALQAFFEGAVGSKLAIGTTLVQATPILLIGLGATLAFRAGLFDIGQPGQFVAGGLAAGVVTPLIPGAGALALIGGMLAGILAGAVWAYGIARFVQLSRVELIVASLVANYLADGIAKLLVSTVFRDKSSYGYLATKQIPMASRLPHIISGTGINAGVVVAFLAVVFAAWAISRTVAGHRLLLFGKSPGFAALSGTPVDAYRRRVLTTSGAICGLAGAIQVSGLFGRYLDGSLGGPESVAWTGLTLAIMVPSGVLALIPGGLVLASLQTGVAGIQRSLGIAAGLAVVLQATILLAVAVSSRFGTAEARPGSSDATTEPGDPARESVAAAAHPLNATTE
jgi:ABC-type uncharacterized transport system permease subunit